MPDEIKPIEREVAYHESGHAVVAYELFGIGATHKTRHAVEALGVVVKELLDGELTIAPDADYLGQHTNSTVFKALNDKLILYADRGIVGVIVEAEEQGDTTYDDWGNDQVDKEGERLNRLCDLTVDVFIAGHLAEEVFRDIPNDPTSDDWKAARNIASRLDRGTDIAGEYDLTSYFNGRRVVVKELLDGKYRHAVEALVEQLLEKKTLTGAEVAGTIENNLLLLGNT